jgi:hypothetical protein
LHEQGVEKASIIGAVVSGEEGSITVTK